MNMRLVLDVADPVLGQRREEGRPAAVRLELLVASEQLGAARPAAVDALGLGVGVLTGEGRSVPASRSTLYSFGLSWARHSASDLTILPTWAAGLCSAYRS